MSIQSTAAINQVLTAFAIGLAQELKDALAEFLAPTVVVSGASGQYKVFDDANSWQIYDTARALGGDATTIQFIAADAYFNCKPQALKIPVDKYERELAGDSPMAQQLLDQGKIKALVNAAVIAHDKKIIDYVVANTTAVSQRGNWSSADVDPIDQLDEQLESLATTVGGTGNIRLALGIKSWRALRNHPKTKARCNGVQVGGITLEQLSNILMFPVQVKIGALGYASKKAPATPVKTAMIGDNVILTAAIPSPTQYDPSGFKVFTTGNGRIDAVRSWAAPNGLYDTHQVDWSEDLKQTSSVSTVRLAIT